MIKSSLCACNWSYGLGKNVRRNLALADEYVTIEYIRIPTSFNVR